MKTISKGPNARRALAAGVDLLADVVKSTLGPGGRLVFLDRRAIGQTPLVTKDGVTVSRWTAPNDPLEQFGADLVREAAEKTVTAAGDGTTTTVLLAQALVKFGLQRVETGVSPAALKRGMDKAAAAISEEVRKLARPVSGPMLEQVAAISANGDTKVAAIVAEAQRAVGDGVIQVGESKTLDTHLEITEGLQIPMGWLSPYFVTDPDRQEFQAEKVAVFLYEGRLGSAKQLVPVISQCMKADRPLLIICGDIENEALQVLVVNRMTALKTGRDFRVCCIRTGRFGEERKRLLRDVALLVSGKAVTEDLGVKVENVVLEDLGSAASVVVGQDKAIIRGTGGTGSPRAAVIQVGAATESEMRELKDRVEDAMYAVKAATKSGVVPGGGLALLRCSKVVEAMRLSGEESYGGKVVEEACKEPLRTIADNAGMAGDAVVALVEGKTQDIGWDARERRYCNLFHAGIIDPALVVLESLKNAVSVAGMILSASALVAQKVEEKQNG